MIEQPTVMGMKVGWSQAKVDEFKKLLSEKTETEKMCEKNPDKMSDRELRGEVKILRKLRESLSEMVSNLRDEVERLKGLDDALRDFNYSIFNAARDELEREGFEDVIASRPLGRKFKA